MKPKRSLSVVGFFFFLMLSLSWEVGAFDKEHIKTLRALVSCRSCDLSNANLDGADLTGLDLSLDNSLLPSLPAIALREKVKIVVTRIIINIFFILFCIYSFIKTLKTISILLIITAKKKTKICQ